MPKPANIKFVLCCDDIRKEDNGKLIAIGIYGDYIILNRSPVKINLAFLMWASSQEAGDYSAKFNVYLEPTVESVASIGFDFNTKLPSERIQIALPAIQLNIGRNGAVVLKQIIDDKEVEIFRLPVQVKDAP